MPDRVISKPATPRALILTRNHLSAATLAQVFEPDLWSLTGHGFRVLQIVLDDMLDLRGSPLRHDAHAPEYLQHFRMQQSGVRVGSAPILKSASAPLHIVPYHDSGKPCHKGISVQANQIFTSPFTCRQGLARKTLLAKGNSACGVSDRCCSSRRTAYHAANSRCT
jgi:hypothetical protein